MPAELKMSLEPSRGRIASMLDTMSRRYTGEDALAYQEGPQDTAGPVNYVQKRLQKRKGIEVVFDPKGQK